MTDQILQLINTSTDITELTTIEQLLLNRLKILNRNKEYLTQLYRCAMDDFRPLAADDETFDTIESMEGLFVAWFLKEAEDFSISTFDIDEETVRVRVKWLWDVHQIEYIHKYDSEEYFQSVNHVGATELHHMITISNQGSFVVAYKDHLEGKETREIFKEKFRIFITHIMFNDIFEIINLGGDFIKKEN